MFSSRLAANCTRNGLAKRALVSAPSHYKQFHALSSLARKFNSVETKRAGPSVASRRWATSTTAHSTTSDPAEAEAMRCMEEGTQKLEEGDVEGAMALYQKSVEIKRTASSLFNLGVTHFHLGDYDAAIVAWKESIALYPSSPDAHTNLASAYIMLPVSRPDLALHHLHAAVELAPQDPEIAFNLAVVLESYGRLEEALEQYKRSHEHGIERAAMHIRNVSAKILGQKMKALEESQSASETKPGSEPKSDS